MRDQRSRSVTRTVCFPAAVIFLLIVATNAASAGQSGRPAGAPDLKRGQREREVRETMLRKSELGAAVETRDQKRIDAAIKQVKEDFRQIQVVRNEMVRNLLAEKPLDYKLISVEAEEINKRADRLKIYLMPPIPDDREKGEKNHVEFNDDEMKGALIRLCNQIASFIENPVLKNPGTVDVEQSTKAGGELLSIIELSGNIKRSAERLNKTPK